MKRYVVYSALVGDYDSIQQPAIVDERFDFILFTNEIEEIRIGVWMIRPIPYYNDDSTRVCRYVKTHPESLLSGYSVSVWMDSSIQILEHSFYRRIIEIDSQGILVSSMCHPFRHCIYEEAFTVVNMMLEHESVVVKWCHHLRKEKYPKDFGLCETGVMYRKHDDSCVKDADALWWDCINHFSRRDQLSFNYVLWKQGIPCHFFYGEGRSVRNTKDLSLSIHKDLLHNHCNISNNEAWLMRHCWKKPKDTELVSALYYRLYAWPKPLFWIGILGQFFRIKDRIK